MSFQIDRGLFGMDVADQYAVLGVAIGADVKEIRKRYLKIARRLHPDSCISESDADKQRASEFLSKLVNPAWEMLSQEKERTEYALLLKLKGKQAARELASLTLHSDAAKQLMNAPNVDLIYPNALQELNAHHYDHLDQVLEITGQISELNLVYLLKKEGSGAPSGSGSVFTGASASGGGTFSGNSSGPATAGSTGGMPTSGGPATSGAPVRMSETLADQYYRRAQEFANKGNYAQAILELRDALKVEPNNSKAHGLLGTVYMRQNQGTMARIHFDQALKFNPQDEVALAGKQALERQKGGGKSGTPAAKPASGGTKKPDDKPKGGMFGGLFGGGKKK
jgi:curved DNA-binding protein CbpA